MSDTRTDKLHQAHERLTEAVESIASGDDWKRMLEVVSKLHRYSSGGITYLKLVNSWVSSKSWGRSNNSEPQTCWCAGCRCPYRGGDNQL
jgi:hypothetical protein